MKWNIAVTKSCFSLKNFYLNAELRGTVEEIAREELYKKWHGRSNSSGCRSVMKLFHIRSLKKKINLSWTKILQLSFTICTIWIHLVLFPCRGKSPALSLSVKNLKDFCSYRDWTRAHCNSSQLGICLSQVDVLTYGSGSRFGFGSDSGSGCQWLTRCQQKISFFCFFLFEGTFTSVFKDKNF